MNQGKYVLAQIFEFVSHNDFLKCVNKYYSYYKTLGLLETISLYGIWTTNSQREFILYCSLYSSKLKNLFHLSIGQSISKSTLSKANEKHDLWIYNNFGLLLNNQTKELYKNDNQLEVEIKNNVFAIDSCIIELCLSVYP